MGRDVDSVVMSYLAPGATTRNRLFALHSIGLGFDELSKAIGMSFDEMVLCAAGKAEPSNDQKLSLDDLRVAVKTMLDQGISCEAICQWLKEPNSHLDDRRPLDGIAVNPAAVLAAAQDEILKQEEESASAA